MCGTNSDVFIFADPLPAHRGAGRATHICSWSQVDEGLLFDISFIIYKKQAWGKEPNTNFNLIIIRLKVRRKIFSGSGDLKIKCTAAIDPIYWRSSEESIQVIHDYQ